MVIRVRNVEVATAVLLKLVVCLFRCARRYSSFVVYEASVVAKEQDVSCLEVTSVSESIRYVGMQRYDYRVKKCLFSVCGDFEANCELVGYQSGEYVINGLWLPIQWLFMLEVLS